MNKNVKRLVEGAETIVLTTENGILIKGDMGNILATLSVMFRQMKKEFNLNKEMLVTAIDLAFKNEEEILEEILKILKTNSK